MQPLIAITVSEITDDNEPWLPTVYGQFRTYTDAVIRAGGVPFVVPLTDDETVLKRLYGQCDGLLLPGGSDLDPASYDRPSSSNKVNPSTYPHLTKVSPRRDHQETKMLEWALRDDKPVLGICRGMQLINVALGGSLLSDISVNLPAARNHEANIHKKNFHHTAHRLRIEAGSRLAAALGTDAINTNSLHHQAVDRLGEGLVATAHAEDGIIEAIELPGKRFIIGVQSHPEALESETEPVWRKLFVAFVDSASQSK